MIKKAVIGAGIALALGAFLFGPGMFSYLRSGVDDARQAARDRVPLDYKLREARQTVEGLVPEIRKSMHVIAEQQVELEHLQEQVARKDEELSRQRAEILALRNELEKGEEQYVFAGQSYTSAEVKRDLATRFGKYKVADESLQRDQQILEARKESLRTNEQLLEEMLSRKQELEVQLAQLEARVKTEQAQEAASTLEIDDSQLARARKLIDDLNKQLDVKAKMRAAEGKLGSGIPVDARDEMSDNIASEIDEYFTPEVATEQEL